MVCSIVSKGVLPFFKGYLICPFQERNVFLGSPVIGAADLVLCQTTHGVFPYSLSHQTWATSVPALSGAKANQVQPGLCSWRKLTYTATVVTWLLVRSWLGWWQDSFSVACQSAKDWYSVSDSDPQKARLMCLVERFLICWVLWFVSVQTSEIDKSVSSWVPKIRHCFLKCLWKYFLLSAILGQAGTSSSLRALREKCSATLPHTEGFSSGCNHDSTAYSKQIILQARHTVLRSKSISTSKLTSINCLDDSIT